MVDLKVVTKDYCIGLAWLLLHGEDDTTKPETVLKIKERVEKAEDDLRQSGVTEIALKELFEKAQKFVATPVSELSLKQRNLLCQLIFGSKSKYVGEVDKHSG